MGEKHHVSIIKMADEKKLETWPGTTAEMEHFSKAGDGMKATTLMENKEEKGIFIK